MAFDTLKLARALRDRAKMTTEQAEAVAAAIADAVVEDIATKSDSAAVRDDITTLRDEAQTDLRRLERRLSLGLGGLILACTAVIAALILVRGAG